MSNELYAKRVHLSVKARSEYEYKYITAQINILDKY